jgi:hypothetical protein
MSADVSAERSDGDSIHTFPQKRADARIVVTLWQGESMTYGYAVGRLRDIAEAYAQRQQVGRQVR